MNDKKTILMLGTYAKGGMREVIRQYIAMDLDRYYIKYITTHVEKNKIVLLYVFILSIFRSFPLFCSRKTKIVHIHCSKKGSYYRKFIFILLSKFFKKKIVLHTHGADFFEYYDACNPFSKAFIKYFFSFPDVVVVLSAQRKDTYIKFFKIKNIIVVPNFVPLPKPVKTKKYNNSRVQVMSLGRIGERKGTDDLIKIFERMEEQNIVLKVGGDGDRDKYEKKIKRLNLENKIQFLGWVSGQAKKDLFEESDIFILPSYQEDLPMAILEAMSYKLPVLATNVAGIPSLVRDGYNGYLLNPGDIDGFSERLSQLIKDVELRKKMAEHSFETVKNNFEKLVVKKQILSLYDGLIE